MDLYEGLRCGGFRFGNVAVHEEAGDWSAPLFNICRSCYFVSQSSILAFHILTNCTHHCFGHSWFTWRSFLAASYSISLRVQSNIFILIFSNAIKPKLPFHTMHTVICCLSRSQRKMLQRFRMPSNWYRMFCLCTLPILEYSTGINQYLSRRRLLCHLLIPARQPNLENVPSTTYFEAVN